MKSSARNHSDIPLHKKVIFYFLIMLIVSFLSMYIGSFSIPLFDSVPFLKYNAGDVPLILLGLIFGPLYATLNTLMISVFEILENGSSSIVGVLMYYLSTMAMLLPSSIIYMKYKTVKSMIIGLFISCFTVTLTMTLWNLIFVPIYMSTSFEDAKALILPGIIPFNLIKTGINSTITIILYPVAMFLCKKFHNFLSKFSL